MSGNNSDGEADVAHEVAAQSSSEPANEELPQELMDYYFTTSAIEERNRSRNEEEAFGLGIDSKANGAFEGWPVELKYDPNRGRYVVASRNLEAGEIVMKAEAYAVAVCENFKLTACSNCWKQSTRRYPDSFACPKCKQMFYCSKECMEEAFTNKKNFSSSYHDPIECHSLLRIRSRANKFSMDDNSEIRVVIQAICRRFRELFGWDVDPLVKDEAAPLQLPTNPPKKEKWSLSFDDWGKLVGNRERRDFNNQRSIRKEAEFVMKVMPPDSYIGLTVEDIMDMFMKLKCNCFGVWSPKRRCLATAVYPTASFFNHSCLCNCCRVTEDARSISIRTIHPVAKGSELCISYVEVKEKAEQRKVELELFYFFSCLCPRCSPNDAAPPTNAVTTFSGSYYKIREEFLVDHLTCPIRNCAGVLYPLHPKAVSSPDEKGAIPSKTSAEVPTLRRCNTCDVQFSLDYEQLFGPLYSFTD
eukprot:TRINITY_DN1984_c0_g2_i3.p1 TRINITY_DN1984_c0_g2~~TRINITY_DN1984_c0_g2_i3.p1  ORF type:complete len:472 (-),score=56.73 TRINITY_DN1984_c0_g2_i3:66-1481(-)